MQEKAVSSILGAAVADAAARPLHWVYDMDHMNELMKDKKNPEFWPESRSPFYTLPTGARSCYNHVLMAGLQAFIKADGEPELDVYRQVLRQTFGDGTAWQEALSRRKEAYTPAVRRKKREPIDGPWLHGAVIHFLEVGHGKEDQLEMDAFFLCLPHLVFRAERSTVVEECLQISSLLSGVETWVRTQAEILRMVIKEDSLNREMLEEIEVEEEAWEAVEQVWTKLDDDHTETVDSWGNNCHLPGSLQGALHSFLRHQDLEGEEGFQLGVRETILAGGCNCSRGNFLGALMGAKRGLKVVPRAWLPRVTDMPSIVDQALSAAKLM